jgi:LCP family protein required for cell wall assembly
VKKQRCPACAPVKGGEMTLLVVGSDSRARVKGADAQSFCKTATCADQKGPEHSDSILLVHMSAASGKASLLSIPRDLYVPIATTKRRDRINTAFSISPDALIQTIKANLGIAVNHYVIVDFIGFRDIVTAMGGVDVPFATPARDQVSGLQVDHPGCVKLDGDNALAYVRSRHYEFLDATGWHPDPTGDIGRMQRQQDFVRRVAHKASSIRDPFTLNDLVARGVHDVRVDSGLSMSTALGLVRRFHSLPPDSLQSFTIPTDPMTVHGADVLRMHEPEAHAVVAQFLQASSPPPDPASVHVRVLNGTGKAGAAAALAQQLRQAGFAVTGTGNAGPRRAASVIRYSPDAAAGALLLQSRLDGPSQLQSDATLTGGNVVLETASSLKGLRQAPSARANGASGAPPPASPSTTAAAPPSPC